MPHIIVKYSDHSSLDAPALLQKLHDGLSSYDCVNPAQTKAYAYPVTAMINGDDTRSEHALHIQVRLLPGRPIERRTAMAETLHAITREHINKTGIPYSLSVEIHELNKETYISSHE